METYGYFKDKAYIVTNRNTPRHWYNYLYNDEYITFVSQVGFGQGIAQDVKGRRISPVTDRNIYICDSEKFWQATGLPVYEDVDEYYCEHNIGYTDIAITKNGVESVCRFFVANTGTHEFLRVTIKNVSNQEKTLKVIPFSETNIDGVYTPQGYNTGSARFYPEHNAVSGSQLSWYGGKGLRKNFAYLTCDRKVSGYDTRMTSFIGAYGNKQMPQGLIENLGCLCTDCIAEKVCFALENTVTLKPGESENLYYTFGVEKSVEDIPNFTAQQIEQQFNEMIEKYADICGGVQIKTPWDNLNNLFNDWLKYQTNMGSRWARVRHNGMRDLTSDSECLGCFATPIAAERLQRVMTYQYSNGYMPRTFLDGSIQDKSFSDNMVWMVFAAHSITKELGDKNYLLQKVKFNDDTVDTVYEHTRRAVEFLWGFTGHYGLVRIWRGDWNDCMDMAGKDGKGVSVWLSIAFVRAAKMLSEMSEWLGLKENAKKYKEYATVMQQRVNEYGWYGDRYIYAISDEGHLIGAPECKEGSAYALPQLWSVFADFEADKQITAMDTLERELNTDIGLLVSHPPYSEYVNYIGSMTTKHPGVHEHGGPYLHGAVWKLAVDSILGRNNKVEEGLRKILPDDHTYFKTFGEPYVMFNSYMGLETGYRVGTPGQSWRTATGQWLLYSLVRFIYGLIPEFDGLVIKPCLPPSWTDCSITKKFRGCVYNIHFSGSGSVQTITVNGEQHNANEPIVPLKDKILNIEVVLG